MDVLMAVIIVGVLATTALPYLPRAMEAARQFEARATLGQIYQAEKLYYGENKKYLTEIGPPHRLMAFIPADDSPDYYFKYWVMATDTEVGPATGFVSLAIRKGPSDVGRFPSWTVAYTISLDEQGRYRTEAF